MKKVLSFIRLCFGIVWIVFVCGASDVYGQCVFNCNDTINVSVNSFCMAIITADLMLEGADSVVCEYGITIYQPDGVTILPGVEVGKDQVGQYLKVRIFENSNPDGPSCWGYVKVEDKLPPPLECAGNDTLECFNLDPYYTNDLAAATLKDRIQKIIDRTDNCGDEEIDIIILENILDRQYCMDGFSAFRTLRYDIYDNSRNVLSCRDTIYYNQIPLDTLSAPKNYSDNMVLDCNDPYPSVGYLISRDGDRSIPNFGGRALSVYEDSIFIERDRVLCNFKMTYTDIVFPTCGNTYKVVREWTVIDWCNSNYPRTINQIIKIVDTDVRIVGGCNDMRGIVSNPDNCEVNVEMPAPRVSDNECSSWTFAIYIKEPGEDDYVLYGSAARNSSTTIINRSFNMGVTSVKYIVTDECGNTDECTYDVEVVDEEPPTAVCDYRTVVTLTDSYLGKVYARSFDDLSYDACSGIKSMKVRRVDRFTTICDTPQDYDDFVKFCCADIGKTIFVEFQVMDSAGLVSTCITEAVVQYKGEGPEIICPPDIPVQDCQLYDDFRIDNLTPPTIISDNPCLEDYLTPLVREVGRDINSCGDGFIDIEWTINLTGVEDMVCTKRIVFENLNLFSLSDISWPLDRVISTCDDLSPTDVERSRLIDTSLACTNVFASDPTDRIFNNVEDACFRIIRTWTVVDWCRYPADPRARWTYVQTITVINSESPRIDQVASSINIVDDAPNCRAQITATGYASDDCTPQEDLKWSFTIYNDGNIFIPSTEGNVISTILPQGSYELEWTVSDDCANSSVYKEAFQIGDNSAPVMLCKSLEKAIEEGTLDAIVTVSDIDDGSYDNCDATFEMGIRRSGTNDEYSALLRFDCQELGITQIELRGMDSAGNESICTASVNILNLNQVCGFDASAIAVSGNIYTVQGVGVENVDVRLRKSSWAMQEQQMTDVEGSYAFRSLEAEQTYILTGEKNDDYANGISTIDIILLQQHILGLRPFEEAYQYLAGDIDNNRRISATDIVLLRRLLLGQISSFPNQSSWIFVDGNQSSEDWSLVWDLPRHIQASPSGDNTQLIGIKIGDINQNAIANSALSKGRSVKTYSLIERMSQEGDQMTVSLEASQSMDIYGIQLGVQYDPQKLILRRAESQVIDLDSGLSMTTGGSYLLSQSSADNTTIKAGEDVITFIFDLKKEGSKEDLVFNLTSDDQISSEIYNTKYETFRLHLVKELKNQESFLLYQNRPNPVVNNTIIEFSLDVQQEIAFSLFDINGAAVFSLNQLFVAGSNQIAISKERLGLNKGIYYYQIKTQKRSLIKKMIIL